MLGERAGSAAGTNEEGAAQLQLRSNSALKNGVSVLVLFLQYWMQFIQQNKMETAVELDALTILKQTCSLKIKVISKKKMVFPPFNSKTLAYFNSSQLCRIRTPGKNQECHEQPRAPLEVNISLQLILT